MENTTDVFAHTMSFQKKTREQKHNSKDSFSIISIKNIFFYFWIHHKKRTAKKRETDLKRRIKKGQLHKNEKPFFQETEKQNMEKRNWSEKGTTKKKKQRKLRFRRKREDRKRVLQKSKKIFLHNEFDMKKHRENTKTKRGSFRVRNR